MDAKAEILQSSFAKLSIKSHLTYRFSSGFSRDVEDDRGKTQGDVTKVNAEVVDTGKIRKESVHQYRI